MSTNANKHRVVIGIPVLFAGGTEKQTLTLVSVLISNGYKVTVCCYYESDMLIVSAMKKAGAEVFSLGLKRLNGLRLLLARLKTLWKEMKPDIVHVQYIAPGFIPVIAAKLAGIKTVFATVHQPGRIYGWKEKLLLRTVAKICTAFFCNSKAVEESWFGNSEILEPDKIRSGRKHVTIYNGVDVDNIARVAKSADKEKIRNSLNINDKKVIGAVGRLRSEKGQAVLLNAMVDVIKDCPDSVLLVVGDGPDRMSLELRAKSLGLENNILWLGQKDRDEVFQFYSVMDIVAVPSLFEGFGLSAAEAMAASRPVVGSRIDGLTEIIEEGITGYTVPVNDSRRLAQAIVALLNSPGKAEVMGLEGHDRVKKMFSLERFAKSTLAAYRYFANG
jgi:glycosyltransferase involved in cell wall biosynthesis